MCPGVRSHPHTGKRETLPGARPRPRATLGQIRLGTQTLVPKIPKNQSLDHRNAESSTALAYSNLHPCSASIGILIVILAVYHGVVVPRARLNFYFSLTYTPAEGSNFPAPNYGDQERQAMNLILQLYPSLGMACV